MKIFVQNIAWLFIFLACNGCIEKADNIFGKQKPRIYIEGVISTNQRTYVKVTLSATLLQNLSTYNIVKYPGVQDASVSISDDAGNIDVLTLSTDETLAKAGYYINTTYHTKLTAGTAYTLKVVCNGQTYEAKEVMPVAPPAIDKVEFTTRKVKSNVIGGSFSIALVPLVSFSEPQDQENYYNFNYDIIKKGHSDSLKTYLDRYNARQMLLLFDDKHLEPEINRLGLGKEWPFSFPVYTGLGSDKMIYDRAIIQIQSWSKEAFNYYKVIEEQLRGSGAYSATPAAPPGNLSNGALGFFRAVNIKTKSVEVKL
ncbi:DUF4249 domain-containing protein [uncultured Microscilla sp.]|uniref:DUF4249 domain-containing protein n=1 Tax=uncultured Microscilla sp. TaxID=432653 RepID=UPI00260A6538|nr:DUF4249 domain-containing protein [uncultured Microscilla sp.]